jgi:hypothetical protein
LPIAEKVLGVNYVEINAHLVGEATLAAVKRQQEQQEQQQPK